jgi:3-oxoacyl-[acyl-carrier protein] reductase
LEVVCEVVGIVPDAGSESPPFARLSLLKGLVCYRRPTALRRIGEPEDIAAVAAFLASDDARWVTGAWLDASGGIRL